MKYYYPIDIDATMTEGTCDGTNFTTGSAFTNSYLLNDQNIASGASSMGSGDAVIFDFGSAVTPTSFSVNIGTASNSGAIIYGTNDGTSPNLIAATISTISNGDFNSTGWYVKTFTGASYRYFIIRLTGTVTGLVLNELFLGYTFTFPFNYDLGNSYRKVHDGIDSIGGDYAGGNVTNKRHGSHWARTWNWGTFSGTDRDNFETFDEAVGGTRAKFVWYDDTSYYWVKQSSPMNATESTYDRYDLPSGLVEQLY